MGGCLSKCGRRKTRETEVLEVSSSLGSDDDFQTNSFYELCLLRRRRRASRKNLAKCHGIANEEKHGAYANQRWAFPNKSSVVFSPIHGDTEAMPKTVRCSPAYFDLSDSPDTSAETIISEDGDDEFFDDPKVTPEDGPSQPLNSETTGKQTINANIKTLKLLTINSTIEEQLEIVDVVSEEEDQKSDDTALNDTVEQDVVEQEAQDLQDALLRPMTAHQKRLEDKHCGEVAAYESIDEGKDDEVTKEPELDYEFVNISDSNGPKVKVITVRPKSPENARIEIITRPKAQKNPASSLKKDKEQMVPKLSEMASLDKNEPENEPLKCSTKFAEETDSFDNSRKLVLRQQLISNEVKNSETGQTVRGSNPIQGLCAGSENTGENDASEPMDAKKKRPVKLYPNTKDRFIPRFPNPVEPPWSVSEPRVGKGRRRKKKDYEDFSTRFMNPRQKVQAIEGRILDGTLITWPKYIKHRVDEGQAPIGGPYKSKMAWGGETIAQSSSASVVHAQPQLNTNQGPNMSNVAKSIQQKVAEPFKTSSSESVPKPNTNQGQVKRFAYKPPAVAARRQAEPFFVEKKLSFHPSTPPESSGEEIDFVFTPENLRRYAKRRRAKLQRRPKTPFHDKSEVVGKESSADHQAEVPPQSSVLATETTKKSPKQNHHSSQSTSGGSKSVTFMIPVESNKARPPSSRPNTRRQMRPKTPRANAGELALRQANAQKRREEAMRSRARGMGKKNHQQREKALKEVELAKAQDLMEKVETKMKKQGENRKKRIESIVAKQAEHHKHVKLQHDVVIKRKRFLGLAQESSSVSNAQFNITDLVEIDRFFEEMDK